MAKTKAKKNEILIRARKHIAQQIKQLEDERKRQLMMKRLDTVSQGLQALEKKQIADAAVYFRSFIKMLEESKGVPDGGLSPGSFDEKSEIGDVLLLVSVYWEMIKVFDRLDSDDGRKIFRDYLERYVSMARNSAFQPLCAEAVRRYLAGGRPRNGADFRKAYDLLGGKSCFVVTSLNDVIDPGTLPALRAFRDESLVRSAWGRAFVRIYYRAGPSLASAMDRMPIFVRRTVGVMIDRIAARVKRDAA
ncbi:MAG: hypothetical protein P4M08_00465 [Oligoflexia bacterium]|nr:hypothetical protein [Oligoflexia bacterium]